jgi:ATP-binding protein involved in chromosome partitioning
MDAMRAAKFIEKLDLPVLGVIENMSGMVCPHCGGTVDLFSSGGGRKAAEDLGVPFLGAIPLDPAMVKAGDEGRPYILSHADSKAWKAVDSAMERLVLQIDADRK